VYVPPGVGFPPMNGRYGMPNGSFKVFKLVPEPSPGTRPMIARALGTNNEH
jgi:hypothetical protein